MMWRRSTFCDTNACVEVAFRKASRSAGNGACVEVAALPDAVLLRDSKDPGVVLAVTRPAWAAFLAGVREGEFDL